MQQFRTASALRQSSNAMRSVRYAALGVAIAMSACARVERQEFAANPLPQAGELVSVRVSPWWQFWVPPQQAWIVNLNGRAEFLSIGPTQADLFSQFAGPLGSVADHATIPVTPVF